MLIAAILALGVALLVGEALALAGFPLPARGGRIGCLDGLRGYLALLVMVHHFDIWTHRVATGGGWGTNSSLVLHNFGPTGVALFFMTTGAVFYPRIRQGFASVDWPSLYVGRVFRILPLQTMTVLVVVVLSATLGAKAAAVSVVQELKHVFMWLTSYAEPALLNYADAGLINAKVLWSLWFEWVFYLVLLPLLSLVRQMTMTRAPSWLIPVVLLVVGMALRTIVPRPAIMVYLPLFAIGMLALEARDRPMVVRFANNLFVTILLTAGGIAAAMWLYEPYDLPQLLIFGAIFVAVASGNSFGGFFSWRGSLVLGEISFGIYLIHGVVLFVLFTFIAPHGLRGASVPIVLACATAVAVFVSSGAHMLIERPGIAAGRAIAASWRRRAAQGEVANVTSL